MGKIGRIAEHARLAVGALACLTLLIALVGLNANFAWELGREAAQFQILFTMGVMALDLMRPGFVIIGFHLNRRGRLALGSLTLAVALVLSPVSILSAALLLGAEISTDADTREALRVQHQALLQRAARDEAAW